MLRAGWGKVRMLGSKGARWGHWCGGRSMRQNKAKHTAHSCGLTHCCRQASGWPSLMQQFVSLPADAAAEPGCMAVCWAWPGDRVQFPGSASSGASARQQQHAGSDSASQHGSPATQKPSLLSAIGSSRRGRSLGCCSWRWRCSCCSGACRGCRARALGARAAAAATAATTPAPPATPPPAAAAALVMLCCSIGGGVPGAGWAPATPAAASAPARHLGRIAHELGRLCKLPKSHANVNTGTEAPAARVLGRDVAASAGFRLRQVRTCRARRARHVGPPPRPPHPPPLQDAPRPAQAHAKP